MKRLRAGQHAVVTGGSSGLGLALAHLLADRGLQVTLVARDPERLEGARSAVVAAHPQAAVRVASTDVADATALAAALADAAEAAGGIDLLINSAGILREGYFEELADADFREVMEVNLFGTVNAVRAALPHLAASRGRVVNIASVAGLMGVFGYTPYCASKHALIGFTESLRFELEPQGIGVQLVCPGEFDSPMVEALDRTRTPENREHVLTIPKIAVEQIAAEVVAGIERGTLRIVPGRSTRAVVLAQRHLPAVARVVSRRTIAKVYRGPAGAAGHPSSNTIGGAS